MSEDKRLGSNITKKYNAAKVGFQAYLGAGSVVCVLYTFYVLYSGTDSCASHTLVSFTRVMKLSFMLYVILDTAYDIVEVGRLRVLDVVHHLLVFTSTYMYMSDCSWSTNVAMSLIGLTEINTVCLYVTMRTLYRKDYMRTVWFSKLTHATLLPFRALNLLCALCVVAYFTFVETQYGMFDFVWFCLQCLAPLAYYRTFGTKVEALHVTALSELAR